MWFFFAANTEQRNLLDDDYGSFMGHVDSELLNQSIESVMPKRYQDFPRFRSERSEEYYGDNLDI